MSKAAQTGIAHIPLIIGIAILATAGYFISKVPIDLFNGTEAAGSRAFSNLSAVLKQESATFNFTYSGFSPNYKIDISTSSNMKVNLQRNFGQSSSSPIVINNPKSVYAPYQCG